MHAELLVEDESTKAALEVLLHRLSEDADNFTFAIFSFDGKDRMLAELESRLIPYQRGRWADALVIVIDQDRDDCMVLKQRILEQARRAGLLAGDRTRPMADVIVRVAMSELESWFLGDPAAVRQAFPALSSADLHVRGEVDALQDAWERLQQPLLARGYFQGRMPKIQTARRIAQHMTLTSGVNRSHSFNVLLKTLQDLVDRTIAETQT